MTDRRVASRRDRGAAGSVTNGGCAIEDHDPIKSCPFLAFLFIAFACSAISP
jgi:hypothetical protein